jgi:hypothetical protein
MAGVCSPHRGLSATSTAMPAHAPTLSFATPVGICPVGWVQYQIRPEVLLAPGGVRSYPQPQIPMGLVMLIMLSASAAAETATKTRMRKAEPRMEEARVTKAEASEAWTERAAAEPAVPASAKSDGNSDRPSPAP